MNWEAVGAVGEVVGAAGVVVTLLYLATQIRLSRQATDANTKVNRAASAAESQDALANINKLLASDASLAKLVTTSLAKGSLDGMTPDEVFRVHIFYRANMQNFEAMYFRYEEGLLESRIWALRRNWVHSFIQTAPVSDWWAVERESAIFTTEFVDDIECAEGGFILDPSAQRARDE